MKSAQILILISFFSISCTGVHFSLSPDTIEDRGEHLFFPAEKSFLRSRPVQKKKSYKHKKFFNESPLIASHQVSFTQISSVSPPVVNYFSRESRNSGSSDSIKMDNIQLVQLQLIPSVESEALPPDHSHLKEETLPPSLKERSQTIEIQLHNIKTEGMKQVILPELKVLESSIDLQNFIIPPAGEKPLSIKPQVQFVDLDSSAPSALDLSSKTEGGSETDINSVSTESSQVLSSASTSPPRRLPAIESLNSAENTPIETEDNFVFSQKEKVNPQTSILHQTQLDNISSYTTSALNFNSAKAPDEKFIPRPLDIIFVIDTSVSMLSYLRNFDKKFGQFLNYLFDLDWQIAITNADYGQTGFFLLNLGALKGEAMPLERDGRILDFRYLDPGVPGYNQIFLNTITVHKHGKYKNEYVRATDEDDNVNMCDLPPFCQSYREQPLKALKGALVKNKDFFRKSADLAVVLISNSYEENKDKDRIEPEDIISQFQKTHGSRKKFKAYGIIINKNDNACLRKNNKSQILFPEGNFAEHIFNLSMITGGAVLSICAPSYHSLAEAIADDFLNP